MAAGGVVMGATFIAVNNSEAPNPDILRLGNGLGFALVGIAGMLAALLSVACLSAQARAAGLFGRRVTVFGAVTAVAVLAAFAFVPIVVLLAWTAAVVVVLRRSDAAANTV